MKKNIIVVFLLLFVYNCLNAGEINVRLGVDLLQYYKLEIGDSKGSSSPNNSISSSAEYLIENDNSSLKIGLGGEYLFKRSEFSFLPVYATIQSGIPSFENLFLKFNLGYNILYEDDKNLTADRKGGLYWAVSVGYEFKSGILLDIGFSQYRGSGTELKTITQKKYNVTVDRFGCQIGYKFKL